MPADPVPFLAPGLAWALVVVFSVLWVALGVSWGARGQGDADDYMLAGRNIGLALSTATLMASWVTGNTTLLAPEFGYKNGLWGMFSYALAGLGLILFAPLALRIEEDLVELGDAHHRRHHPVDAAKYGPSRSV